MDQTNEMIPLHALAHYLQSRAASRPMAQDARSAFAAVAYRTDKLHRHDYFEVYVVDQGSGVCIADSERFFLKPLSIFVIPPGTVHYWENSTCMDGFIARVPLIEGHALLTSPDIRPDLFEVLSDVHRHILALFDWIVADDPKDECRRNPISRLRWRLMFECLSTQAHFVRQNGTERSPSDVSSAFMSLLERKFHLRWGVQDYAKTLKTSRSSLLRATQASYGCSPAELILKRTLKEAERLLLTTDYTCADISETLGYLSQAQFTRSFSNHFDEAPTSFRRSRLAH